MRLLGLLRLLGASKETAGSQASSLRLLGRRVAEQRRARALTCRALATKERAASASTGSAEQTTRLLLLLVLGTRAAE